MTPTRPYTGDIPETRTLSIFYKLKETDRGSPEPQRVGSNVTQQVRVTQPVSVAAAALESRGPLAPACGHNAPGKVGIYIWGSHSRWIERGISIKENIGAGHARPARTYALEDLMAFGSIIGAKSRISP